jgi:hypothetical protein
MIAQIRLDYVTICPVDAHDDVVESVAEQVGEAIIQEERLKELGIDLNELLGGHF